MSPKLIMMCGLPASGKSFKAKEIAEEYNATIHSSDDIRAELSGDVDNQNMNQKVFEVLHKRVKKDLLEGSNVVYDATNINYKRRKGFINELKKIECEKNIVLVATPYKDCLIQNQNRDCQVPEYVIKNMYMNFNIPYWYEGWDYIFVKQSTNTYNIKDFYSKYKNYNQENSHHQQTLGEHSLAVSKILSNYDKVLETAGFLHDCGKPFTKSFIDSKGKNSTDAHFYQHHCVGAYNSLFYDHMQNRLSVALLIQWHMQPYFWERDKVNGEKQKEKYKKLWGERLFSDIMLLHKADIESHQMNIEH